MAPSWNAPSWLNPVCVTAVSHCCGASPGTNREAIGGSLASTIASAVITILTPVIGPYAPPTLQIVVVTLNSEAVVALAGPLTAVTT
jgi:hypothetical protein